MKKETSFEQVWKNGEIVDNAPQWAKYRKVMTQEFPSPFRGSSDPLVTEIGKAVGKIDNLRPEVGGPAYLGASSKLTYTMPEVKNVKIAEKGEPLDKVVDDLIGMFNGMPNVASPLTMANVWPQPSTASIIASILPLIYMPNIIEGEYSWNVHKAELESAGMLGNLFRWNPTSVGCIYTYGGSGCWLYALKYALTRVLPESRDKGIRVDAKVLVSEQSHYCRMNATDWSGLGMNNVVLVRTNPETNEMDVQHLEELLKDFRAEGIPVAEVVCTMGTTDASVFDPIAKVRELMDKYPNPDGYGKALLYADSVAGWSWAYFHDYDFEKNPLEFSAPVLQILRKNAAAISDIHLADAVGIDFHKFGWSPYVSSCFLYKSASEFEYIMRRGSYAYLQEVTPYNPMDYTLEVSRSAAGSLAGWATLKYLGKDGMRAILGGIMETKMYMMDLLTDHTDMICVDEDNNGMITLFRVYPEGVDAKVQYNSELNNPDARAELIKSNELTLAIGEKMFQWYLDGKKINGKFTPHTSYSTGFRSTNYDRDMKDAEATIYALKAYPMNVFVTPDIMKHTLDCITAARDEVLKDL